MSEDTYKGESPQKKLVRLWIWNEIERHRELDGPVVFLAGRNGPDVDIAEFYGIPRTSLWAVEREASAAESFARRHPDIRLHTGDAIDLAGENASVVYLDFCSQACEATFHTLAAFVARSPEKSVVAWNVLRGREQHSVSLVRNRNDRRTKSAIGYAANANAATHNGESRSLIVWRGVMARLPPERPEHQRWLIEVANARYHSRSRETNGSPFESAVTRLVRGSRALKAENWRRRKVFQHKGLDVGESEALVREIATLIAEKEGVATAARLLFLEERTVIAWKAHATRGTYEAAE